MRRSLRSDGIRDGLQLSSKLSLRSARSRYHPQDNHTIRPGQLRSLSAILAIASCAFGPQLMMPRPPRAATPSPMLPYGFAPPGRTDFAPILQLVPPGPHRAERAMAVLDRQLIFQRQVLHPEYSPALDHLFEKIPPRNSTLIRAASIYSRSDIPWTEVDGTHQLCAEGYPSGGKFYVTTVALMQDAGAAVSLGRLFRAEAASGIATPRRRYRR